MTIDVEQRLRRAANVLDEHLTTPAKSPYAMEVDFMNDRFTPRTRRAGVGAAVLALVALVVVAVVIATGNDDDKVLTPVNDSTTTTTPPTTTNHFPLEVDQKIAQAILLPDNGYAADWKYGFAGAVDMDAAVAESIPACAPYVDVVFEGPNRPAGFAYKWFKSPLTPPAASPQYTVVLTNDAAAKAMFDAMDEPAFNDGCVPGYIADPFHAFFPLAPSTLEVPALTLAGDQYALRYYTRTEPEGPVRYLLAIVRVGRTITIIETITHDSAGNVVIPLDKFQQIVADIVQRAHTALSEPAA